MTSKVVRSIQRNGRRMTDPRTRTLYNSDASNQHIMIIDNSNPPGAPNSFELLTKHLIDIQYSTALHSTSTASPISFKFRSFRHNQNYRWHKRSHRCVFNTIICLSRRTNRWVRQKILWNTQVKRSVPPSIILTWSLFNSSQLISKMCSTIFKIK